MELARENVGAFVGVGTTVMTLNYLLQEIPEIKQLIKSLKGKNCGLQVTNFAG